MCDTQYLRSQYECIGRCLSLTMRGLASPREYMEPRHAYHLLGAASRDVCDLVREVERLRRENAELKCALNKSRAETEAVAEKLDKYVCGEISWLEL